MCGRYYLDDETVEEIETVIGRLEGKEREDAEDTKWIETGDICPGETAPVLRAKKGIIRCVRQYWGFRLIPETRQKTFQETSRDVSLSQGKKIIFNARCETALEKPLFRDSVRYRRIVVPAAGFYEWNVRKEKNIFCRKDEPVLFMAGFCSRYEDGEHFVILTTTANASVEPVHNRMPLILEREEITDWLLNDEKTVRILEQSPGLLERKTEYAQMCLF